MGTSTTLVGCLPSYQQAGVAAPAILAVLRVAMGFAMGGEFTTAVCGFCLFRAGACEGLTAARSLCL